MTEFFKTPEGEIVIGQKPNLPIKATVVLGVAALLTHGEVKKAAARGAGLAFLARGMMELGWGVNAFRRTLGAAAILLTGVTFTRPVIHRDQENGSSL